SGLIYTRLWLAAAVLVIGAAQVAADQFLRRRLVRSVTAAAVVLGVVALVGRFWPWDGSGFLVFLVEKEPAPRIQVPSDAVQLFAGSAQLQGHTDDKNSSRIQQNFLVKGVPTGLAIGNPTFAQTWSWLDRSIDRGANGFFYPTGGDRPLLQLFSLPELAWDPETMRWLNERQAKVNATRVARGLSPLPETRPATLAGIEIAAVNFLPDADVARMQAQPPVYQARVQLSLSRLRLITECGLAPGIRRTGESRSVQLLPAIRTSDRVSIGAVMTAPALWKNGLWYAGAPPFPGHGWSSPLEAGFFAIDRAAGTYSWVSVNQLPPPVVQVAGVHISWHRLAFTTPKVVRDGHWVVRDPEWFDHTTLAIVSWYEGLALINREVKVEQYKLETPAPETTGKTF
ncbi:MAG: hypothetical protein JWQ83_702, partial [Lacunisphaera sp.]|nr:hypothetical protein [Lacunisphaera sp.]